MEVTTAKSNNRRGRKKGFKFPPPTLTADATVVRPRQLPLAVGFSNSKALRMEATGDFPKRISLGGQSVGWARITLENWLKSRLAVNGEV